MNRITTDPKPAIGPKTKAAGATGTIIALAALIMSQFTPIWEGRSLTPYQDVVGVWTVCEGETRVEMRAYTEEECNALSKEMYEEFAGHVLQVTPGIEDQPFMLAAFADTAINVGKGAYNRSSMRREFLRGNYREACRSLQKYVFAGGRKWRGLELRRLGDRSRIGSYEVCMADAVEAELKVKGVL